MSFIMSLGIVLSRLLALFCRIRRVEVPQESLLGKSRFDPGVVEENKKRAH
jgi:hypothetical protein